MKKVLHGHRPYLQAASATFAGAVVLSGSVMAASPTTNPTTAPIFAGESTVTNLPSTQPAIPKSQPFFQGLSGGPGGQPVEVQVGGGIGPTVGGTAPVIVIEPLPSQPPSGPTTAQAPTTQPAQEK